MSRAAAPRPAAVYAIADAEALGARGLADGAEAMAQAGLKTIQLRAKRLPDAMFHREAERCLRALEGWDGALWVDDRVDLAAILPFSGVHLGQLDLPPVAARRLLPPDLLVGASSHDETQWSRAQRDAAVDWIAVGPVFATSSKPDPDPVVGLELLGELARRGAELGPERKPLIAIGGIDEQSLPRVLARGADSAAVLSAVCVGDVEANCRRLLLAAG